MRAPARRVLTLAAALALLGPGAAAYCFMRRGVSAGF